MDRKSEKYIGGSLNENCLIIILFIDDDRGKYLCIIINVVGLVLKVVIFGNFYNLLLWWILSIILYKLYFLIC